MGDWKGFERLAERIAHDLHPDATVTLDDHLPGRFTEKKRQIDVSIRWADTDREPRLAPGADHPLLWIDLHPSAEFPCRIHLVKGEQLALEDGFPLLHVPGGPRIHPAAVFEQLWNERAIPDTPGVQHTIQSAPLSAPVLRVDGHAEWRDVDLQVVYEVDRRAWLGQFTPNQCRGLVDYLDNNAFTASHLPIGEIPTERNDQWVDIDDPDGVAVRVRGTLVTTIGYKLAPGAFNRVDTTVTPPGLPPERLP